MDEHIERYLSRVDGLNAEATYDTYRTNLRHFDQWLNKHEYELVELSAMQLDEYFIQMRADDYAPNTIASRYRLVEHRVMNGDFHRQNN